MRVIIILLALVILMLGILVLLLLGRFSNRGVRMRLFFLRLFRIMVILGVSRGKMGGVMGTLGGIREFMCLVSMPRLSSMLINVSI